MDIPVYLIAGFLDAGKTDFINGILKDGFAAEDRTLLICCEEGENEYDPKVLQNVFTYTIDDPAQMTPALFKKLEKQYRPKQVIMEYNGMWQMEPLYREGFPANWILYQIMVLVDATTFEPYVRNMGQLMMEKIANADLLIFNRCNEELRAQLRSRNLKMVNRRADIYLENADGTSEEYMTPDMSPFDLSSGHLDVPDDEYGVWYVDPATLQSNEQESTATPTNALATQPVLNTSHPDLLIYYNPEGGTYYHIDPNCESLNPKYRPLSGVIKWSQIEDDPYDKLEQCKRCGAPLREKKDNAN